jgi:hypothetical protein
MLFGGSAPFMGTKIPDSQFLMKSTSTPGRNGGIRWPVKRIATTSARAECLKISAALQNDRLGTISDTWMHSVA